MLLFQDGVLSLGLDGMDCASALLMYKLSSFNLLPFNDFK